MRLFISVNLPSEINEYLEQIKSKIRPDKGRLSFSHNSHITLKFLGEIGDNRVSGLIASLKTIDFSRFKANLGIVGIFPNENNIRVIWVGAEPEAPLKELAKQVDLATRDFALNDREFVPHITLARVKFIEDKAEMKRKISSLKIEKKEFDVDAFYLMKSALTPEGPVYEAVEEFKLK